MDTTCPTDMFYEEREMSPGGYYGTPEGMSTGNASFFMMSFLIIPQMIDLLFVFVFGDTQNLHHLNRFFYDIITARPVSDPV